jgi:S1-C subfamily serine protease
MYPIKQFNPMLEYFTVTRGTNTGTSRNGIRVIISEDGYIVTNNHVIKGASE